MKKYFTLLILIFVTLGSEIIFSWDTTAAKFFPMEIGNSWTYTKRIYGPPMGCITPINNYDHKVSISGDSVFNSHRYFKFTNGNLMRIDSISMNVYKWEGAIECLSDSLYARINDFVPSCMFNIQLIDTNSIIFAGQSRLTKAVAVPGYMRRLMFEIGLYFEGGCEPFTGSTDELKGCVINNVVYGDTSVTPVPPLSLDFLRYYPLSVGNTWIYNGFGFPCCGAYLYKVSVLSSEVANGHLYYIISNTQTSDLNYVRIDSMKGIILYKASSGGCGWLNQETTGDSLAARLNDKSSLHCTDSTVCNDTLNQKIFDMAKKRKIFYNQYFEGYESRKYVTDIGLVRIENQLHMGHDSKILKGAVINGVVYGDTNMTDINRISWEVPEKFSLSQNYPNPFNPVTLIKFEIPNSKFEIVKLNVYDVLGCEVQTLVNEKLSPGTYEVEFDGTNFSSGVYYYKLISGEFTQTRKMVLIK